MRPSPSDKARLHSRPFSAPSPSQVGEEWCQNDPYYKAPVEAGGATINPFATLPRLREGRKIIGSTFELFSSCFELPSPRVTSPSSSPSSPKPRHAHSLPSSPPSPRTLVPLPPASSTPKGEERSRSLLWPPEQEGRSRNLLPYRGCLSQDDSLLGLGSSSPLAPCQPLLRRVGSCESGGG